MSVLVVAEHDNRELKQATLSVVTAAAQLGGDIEVLVMGNACGAVAEQAAGISGVARVLLAEAEAFTHFLPEVLAPALAGMASAYSHIMAPASTFGKNLMPRVAALLDVGQISEISAIESADTFVRPIYAGNAMATVQSLDNIKVLTVRASAFDKAETGSNPVAIETLELSAEQSGSEFVSEELTISERPELSSASVVISGGRGLGSGENFKLLDGIADKLGAAIGASRAAVDAGYVSNDLQVGQTGKIVAPDLYIAVGISGAIQHLAGMKDSKVIVAINKDPDAPIFQAADYGLVGDLFTILPEIEALL